MPMPDAARIIPASPGGVKNPYVDPSLARYQRIDYIFAATEFVPKDCAVVFDGNNGLGFASDHFGVFCRLAFR